MELHGIVVTDSLLITLYLFPSYLLIKLQSLEKTERYWRKLDLKLLCWKPIITISTVGTFDFYLNVNCTIVTNYTTEGMLGIRIGIKIQCICRLTTDWDKSLILIFAIYKTSERGHFYSHKWESQDCNLRLKILNTDNLNLLIRLLFFY